MSAPNQLRVLLWAELFWPYIGGVELFATRLMTSLRERGYDFAVVTSRASSDLPDEDLYQGIPVYRFPFRDAFTPQGIAELVGLRRRVPQLVRRLKANAIFLAGVTPSALFCMAAAEGAQVPLLVRVNQEIGERSARAGGKTLSQQVLRAAAWVVGVSDAILAQWVSLAPEVAARSSVVYNGVVVPAVAPPAPRQEPPRILCLGRLLHQKGFDVALEALRPLLRRWPGARLTVAGDGPERTALEARATELGIAEQVEFTGLIPPEEVPLRMSAATLVLIPSRQEGLPAVALEAAAAGRPIVATRCGGLPEVVQDDRTGLLVDLDGDAIAAAIASLLDRPEVIVRMGATAWKRARTVFSWERCVDDYDALLRRVAAG